MLLANSRGVARRSPEDEEDAIRVLHAKLGMMAGAMTSFQKPKALG